MMFASVGKLATRTKRACSSINRWTTVRGSSELVAVAKYAVMGNAEDDGWISLRP